jgi:hypothetical protein
MDSLDSGDSKIQTHAGTKTRAFTVPRAYFPTEKALLQGISGNYITSDFI